MAQLNWKRRSNGVRFDTAYHAGDYVVRRDSQFKECWNVELSRKDIFSGGSLTECKQFCERHAAQNMTQAIAQVGV